jgi:hypothetical protein
MTDCGLEGLERIDGWEGRGGEGWGRMGGRGGEGREGRMILCTITYQKRGVGGYTIQRQRGLCVIEALQLRVQLLHGYRGWHAVK